MSRARDLADSADLNFDSGTLVIDSANNRVGIGTSNPSNALHIQKASSGGTASSNAALIIEGTDATKAHIQLLCDTNDTQSIYFGDAADNDIGRIAYDHTNNNMRFTVNASERARIDSSGNLLVGTTTSEGTGGVTLKADGGIYASRAGTHFFNRESTDGDIVRFQKSGATVGSITTRGGDVLVGTGDTAVRFDDGNDAITPQNITTNTGRDAAIDLGISSGRFKDLYLSGGVYLGGTGAANYLDDYEEGTWTPSYVGTTTAGTVTYTSRGGTYTKIGNQVTIYFSLVHFSVSGASGSVRITGVPFQASFSNNVRVATSGNVRMYKVNIDDNRPYVTMGVENNTSYINFLQGVDDGAWIAQPVDNDSSQYIEGYVTYTTAS